jgi:hypothetical protein
MEAPKEKIHIQKEFRFKPGVSLLKKDRAFTTNLQFFPCPDEMAVERTKDAAGRPLFRNPIWTYELGLLSITLLGQADVGLPYGIISRLIINWIDNEIVYNTKKGSSKDATVGAIKGGYKIIWSESVSEFCVKNLGIAKSSTILKEIQNQFEKIAAMTFRTTRKEGDMIAQEEIPFVVEKKYKWNKSDGKLISGDNNSWIVIHPEYVRYVIARNFYFPPEMIKHFLRNAEGIDLYKYFKYIQTTQKNETEIPMSEIKEKIGWTGQADNLLRKVKKIISEIMEYDETMNLEISLGSNRFKESVIKIHNALKGSDLMK